MTLRWNTCLPINFIWNCGWKTCGAEKGSIILVMSIGESWCGWFYTPVRTIHALAVHIYCTSNRRHNWNLVEHLHHELFCRIVNMVSPLAIFVEELHCVSLTGCLTGFLMAPCPITYYSWKKVLGEALHYWSYTRESWNLGHQ